MAIVPFLAMTAAEMRQASCYPEKIAWMACHFSPYSTGLSNLPTCIPPGSLLMVDDITPPHGHDPVLITEQLTFYAEKLQCCGILLDFQRQSCPETAALAKHLSEALPYPTAVSESYAGGLDCPVFLSSIPPSVAPEDHLRPWQGREVWMEIGLWREILTLTQQGCTVTPLSHPDLSREGFSDPKLHCHYTIETNEKSAGFTLWRTAEDIQKLLEVAETLGVTTAVGLFQELHGLAAQ